MEAEAQQSSDKEQMLERLLQKRVERTEKEDSCDSCGERCEC